MTSTKKNKLPKKERKRIENLVMRNCKFKELNRREINRLYSRYPAMLHKPRRPAFILADDDEVVCLKRILS